MRMAVEEMQKKYPNSWLGISEPYYGINGNIISAEVVYSNKTASELGLMALGGENIEPYFTTPDDCFQLGGLIANFHGEDYKIKQ